MEIRAAPEEGQGEQAGDMNWNLLSWGQQGSHCTAPGSLSTLLVLVAALDQT